MQQVQYWHYSYTIIAYNSLVSNQVTSVAELENAAIANSSLI